jgi:predicted nucleotidyltransferase
MGPPANLQELRRRSGEIKRVAWLRGARTVRVFGSIARGDDGPGSDLDLLVEMGDGCGLLEQAALQGDLEERLGCRVHVLPAGGLTYAGEDIRERIEREAVSL